MADQLISIIQQQVGLTDPALQKQAEAALNSLSEQDAQSFILNLAQISYQSEDEKVRIFAISHLRKRISKFSEQSFSNLWEKLSAEVQAQIKVGLFEMLKIEKVEAIRNLTCDCIGELGGSLLDNSKEAGGNLWPELIPMVWELFMREDPAFLVSGFKILVNLLTFAPDSFEERKNELSLLFANGIKNADARVSVACIQAIGAYVSIMDKKQTKEFQVLVPSMLEQLYAQSKTSEDNAQTILEIFTDIAETEPKFLQTHFELLFSTIWKINMVDQEVETSLKHTGTEMIISLLQRLPQLARKNEQYITRLIEMIFKHMVEIDEEITDEWKHPAEGFNEDIEEDADFETTRFGMNAIDRLIESIGDKEVLPILSSTVQKLLEHSDWRYNFSAIMALSQVGEYIDDVNTVKPIINLVLTFLQKENPMIRYSVFHAIGQISDDMKPSFQQEYKDTITPILLRSLDDPVPRVVSHAAAALTNFIEGVSDDEVEVYLKDILLKLLSLVESGCSIVKENCMTAIASTAEAAKHKFHAYFNDIMPILFSVFVKYPGKAYKQLRGQAIECITLISQSVDKAYFLPHLQEITKIIVTVQNSTLESTDPQKSYVLTGWQRLSLSYSEELTPFLPEILPGVFNLIQQITQKSSTGEDGCDIDEAETALSMLEVFIEQFGKAFAPHVEAATNIIVPLCEFKYSDSIRQAASECVPGLVKSAVDNPEIQKNMVRFFLGKLLGATSQEYDSTVIQTQIIAMRDCITSVGRFMTQEELDQLIKEVVKLLLDSDKRMTENEKWSKEDDVDDDEQEYFQEDLEMEEDLQTAISELLGALYKTHKEQTIPLANHLYSQVLPKLLDASGTDKNHKFGIFLIDDMIEFLGYELMSEKWNDFATALKMFSLDKSCKVRQAAVYGIGMLAINTPTAQFAPFAEPLLESLIQASKLQQGQEKETEFGHARDNSIASIGKIIKAHSIVQPNVISIWVNSLPLGYDRPEAHVQHAFLAEIINSRPDIITSQNELVSKTIQVFAQVLDTKFLLAENVPSVNQAVKVLAQNQYAVANFSTIIASLNQAQKDRLQKAFSA